MRRIWEWDGVDRSVSPVIATILVVAITVIIAAAIGATAFGYTDRLGSTTVAAGDDQCIKSVEFDPADVSSFANNPDLGCVIWLDASQTSYSTSEDVTTWEDQSPNEFDMTTSGVPGIKNPSYAGEIEGVPAVEFDRSNTEGLTTDIDASKTDIVSDTTLTVTALVRVRDGESTVFQAGDPDDAFDYFRFGYNDADGTANDATPWFFFAGEDAAGNPVIRGHEPTAGGSLGKWVVVTHIHDGDKFTSYVNGQQRYNIASEMNISDGAMQVGYEFTAAGTTRAYMDGYMSEIIVFEKPLTDDQREGLECALDAKHGSAVNVQGCD